MTLNTGNRVKNILTGKVYRVKKINKDWVLLQAEDGSSQVLTGKDGPEIYICVGKGGRGSPEYCSPISGTGSEGSRGSPPFLNSDGEMICP